MVSIADLERRTKCKVYVVRENWHYDKPSTEEGAEPIKVHTHLVFHGAYAHERDAMEKVK